MAVARTDVSRPTRGMSGSDVMFLLSIAFLVLSFVLTLAVIRH